MIPASLRIVSQDDLERGKFTKHLADCVILTHDHKIMMQERTASWGKMAGVLTLFGGHVEEGETIIEGLLRELHEEVGAAIAPGEVTFIGAVSEDFTNHSECVHVYFWHDKDGRITGCYEAEPRLYDTVQDTIAHPKIMDYAMWALKECAGRGFLSCD